MRRIIVGSFLTATLCVPALSFAKPTNGRAAEGSSYPAGDSPIDRPMRPHDQPTNGPTPQSMGSLGNGAVGGNEPGHVESPGTTKIDPESRGPINDVQPGRGTNDTPQSANPKPVR